MGKNVGTIERLIGAVIVGLFLLAGAIWLAWRGLSALSVTVLKATVLLLAAGVPTAWWIGWRLGNRESTATLHGVDEVATRVLNTAEHVASLRVGAHRAVKQGGNIFIAPLALPPVIHRSLDAGTDDIVDL